MNEKKRIECANTDAAEIWRNGLGGITLYVTHRDGDEASAELSNADAISLAVALIQATQGESVFAIRSDDHVRAWWPGQVGIDRSAWLTPENATMLGLALIRAAKDVDIARRILKAVESEP